MNLFKNRIFLVFAIFSYLKPSGFDFYSFTAINTFFNFTRILFAAIIICKYFSLFKRISNFILIEIIFFISLLLSTILNGSELSNYFIFSLSIITFSMLVEICTKTSMQIFIKSLFFNYFILIMGNLLIMCQLYGFHINYEDTQNYLTGTGTISFLASDNMTASYVFPAIASGFLYSIYKNQKYNIYVIILYFSIILTELMLWSATSLIGVAILYAYILFIYKNKKIERWINNKLFIFGSLFLLFGITFGGLQDLFSYIIVNILQKDLTMTGRTSVWSKGLSGFNNNILLGSGYNVSIIDNGLIQILYMGGIIGLIILCILFRNGTKAIISKNPTSIDLFFSVILSVIIIMSSAESWSFFFGFYVILSITKNIHKNF